MERDNVTSVINLLIGELRIPVTRQSIEEEIEKHPEHESLLAISELLDHWHISNATYELAYCMHHINKRSVFFRIGDIFFHNLCQLHLIVTECITYHEKLLPDLTDLSTIT